MTTQTRFSSYADKYVQRKEIVDAPTSTTKNKTNVKKTDIKKELKESNNTNSSGKIIQYKSLDSIKDEQYPSSQQKSSYNHTNDPNSHLDSFDNRNAQHEYYDNNKQEYKHNKQHRRTRDDKEEWSQSQSDISQSDNGDDISDEQDYESSHIPYTNANKQGIEKRKQASPYPSEAKYSDYTKNNSESNIPTLPTNQSKPSAQAQTSSKPTTTRNSTNTTPTPTATETGYSPVKFTPPPLPATTTKPSKNQPSAQSHLSSKLQGDLHQPLYLYEMNDEIARLEKDIGYQPIKSQYSTNNNNPTYNVYSEEHTRASLGQPITLIQPSHTTTAGTAHTSGPTSSYNQSYTDKKDKKNITYTPYTLEQYKQSQCKEYVEIVPKLRPG